MTAHKPGGDPRHVRGPAVADRATLASGGSGVLPPTSPPPERPVPGGGPNTPAPAGRDPKPERVRRAVEPHPEALAPAASPTAFNPGMPARPPQSSPAGGGGCGGPQTRPAPGGKKGSPGVGRNRDTSAATAANRAARAARVEDYTELRMQQGLTIAQAGKRLGVTRRSADRYEAERKAAPR